MNFEQKIAAFVIGDLKYQDLPGIAITGLKDDFDCENLRILSSLSKDENPFILNEYFSKTLNELEIKLPARPKAIEIVIEYYTNEILKGNIDAYLGTSHLVELLGIDIITTSSYDLFDLFSEYELITESLNDEYTFFNNKEISKEAFIENCKKSILERLEQRKKRKNTP